MIGEMRDANLLEQSSESNIEDFDILLGDVRRELYPGCKKYSLLSFIVKLLQIKVINRMTDKTMNMILELIKDILPEGNIVPPSLYCARKLLSGIGLGYKKIDVCMYDCALFWKENEEEEFCPIYKEPRWKYDDGKGKRIPHKVLWYFPLKPWLQRLFMSSKTASYMRWHAEKRIDVDGSLSHPADSPSWKDFDAQKFIFTTDSCNVRLGLASEGFNPFGNMRNSYSMWPVILIPYNIPLYKWMKDEFFMMPLLIPGPRAPKKDIDVYLRPLTDELKELWNGVETYDASSKESSQMRATIMWTINDFPALSNLLGWTTKGYGDRPCCFYETDSKKWDIVGYVRNKARLEGSFVEGYILKECLTFMSMYIDGNESRCNKIEQNYDGAEDHQETELSVFVLEVRPFGPLKHSPELPQKDIDKAQKFILNNCSEVDSYKSKHKEQLKKINEKDIEKCHAEHFHNWFREHINMLHLQSSKEVSEELWAMANGPQRYLTKFYSGCIVNEVRFHIKDRDDNQTTQNSKLFVEGEHKNEKMEFYGLLTRVVGHEDLEIEAMDEAEQRVQVAFQPHESNGVTVVLENEDDDLEHLARKDLDLDVVDEEVFERISQQRTHEIDDDDAEDESTDEEDETLTQYCENDDDNRHFLHFEGEEDK
ncbi:hypothetical protein BUALT_Bualt10G0037400 [Buddleja alternifolia]|uniref:DUF4218 domain-containing protein n=1 Tax=Buddleja alternifolia TaxID=168488 RepID=A0AAV6X0M2_9LAMI|nr:hypothetical protein BUALT_Bualt10G0037400 [Buddleja alternifolia]